MGQAEVFNWLKVRRQTGDESYFLPNEIAKGLKEAGYTNGYLCNIRGDCFRLWQGGNGCLEMIDNDKKGMTNWLKAFRIKKKYCECEKHDKSSDKVSKGVDKQGWHQNEAELLFLEETWN